MSPGNCFLYCELTQYQNIVKSLVYSLKNSSVCFSICWMCLASKSFFKESTYSCRTCFTARDNLTVSGILCSAQYFITLSAYTHAKCEMTNGTNAIIMFSLNVNVFIIQSVSWRTLSLNCFSVIIGDKPLMLF